MRHLTSGTKKSVLPKTVFSVSARKIISGSMGQVRVVRVLRFILTVERNTDVESLDVQLDVSATVISRSGTMYLPSLKMMAKATIQN